MDKLYALKNFEVHVGGSVYSIKAGDTLPAEIATEANLVSELKKTNTVTTKKPTKKDVK